jgi:hypothetical protein
MYLGNQIFSLDEVNFIASGNGSVKITCKTESRDSSIIVALTSSEQVYKRDISNEGKMVSFKFENIEGSDFCIKQPRQYFSLPILAVL